MITAHSDKSFNFDCIDCGLFSVEGEWIYPKRTSDCYELIFPVKGNIHIRQEDKEYVLKKRDVLILRPNVNCEGIQGSFGKTSFYWAKFTCDQNLFDEDYFFINDENLSGLFDKLLHMAHTPNEPKYIADALLLTILNDIRQNRLNDDKKALQFVRDVAEWIRINRDKRLTVETVSKIFGYNPDYLSGVFSDCYGIGLKEYINQQKIDMIKDLLLTSNYSIKYLADILGYSNENQFINYFKYHTGLSPTKFKSQYYNAHFLSE